MGKQINQYVTTRATLLANDLLDIDATDDLGVTFDSQKVTYDILKDQIGVDIGFALGTYKEIPFMDISSSQLQYSSDLTYDFLNRDILITSSLVNFEQGIELSSTNGGNAVYPRFRSDANGTFTEVGSYGLGHADVALAQKSVIKSRGTTLGMVFLTQSAANDPFEWRSGLDGSDLQMTLSNGTLILDTVPALDNAEDDLLAINGSGNVIRRSASSIAAPLGGSYEIPHMNVGATALQYDPVLTFNSATSELHILGTQNASYGFSILATDPGTSVHARFESSISGAKTDIGTFGTTHTRTALQQKSVVRSSITSVGLVFSSESLLGGSFEWYSDTTDILRMSLINGVLKIPLAPALDNAEDDILAINAGGDVIRRSALTINATHTGEVTGSTTLTVSPTAISNKAIVTGVAGDHVLITDASDSGNLKRVDLSDLLGGATLWTDDGGGDISRAGGTVKITGVGLGINPIFRLEDLSANTIMEFLDNRTGLIVSGNTTSRSEIRFKEGFIEIIKTGEAQTIIGAGATNQLLISGASNTISGFDVSNSLIIGKLNTLSATGTIDSVFITGNSHQVKQGNFNFVSGSAHIVNSGDNSFAQGTAVTIGGSRSMGVGNNIAVNNNNVFAFGDFIDSTVENSFLVGRNLSINTTSFKEGVFFGHSPVGSTFPSVSFVYNDDPTDTGGAAGRLLNVGIGSIEIGRHNNTQGAARAGAGSGILYLSNDSTFLIEPVNNVVNAVGLWAKDRIAGQMGLLVKSENGTKHILSDRVGINNITPAAMVHVDQSSTTAAIPVITLNQADLSEEFINFSSTVGAGNPIDTAALGTYYGKVRVNVEGVGFKVMALYNS